MLSVRKVRIADILLDAVAIVYAKRELFAGFFLHMGSWQECPMNILYLEATTLPVLPGESTE